MSDDKKYLGSDPFWQKIHKYLKDHKLEIEMSRSTSRRGSKVRKCPACSAVMGLDDMHGIYVDRCSQCGGVFFDKGELELLIAANKDGGFFAALKRLYQ